MSLIKNDNGRMVAYDAEGRQTLKGGTTVNAGFFEACIQAYCNVMNNGVATLFLALVSILTVSEYVKEGILETAAKSLTDHDATKAPYLVTLFVNLLLFVLKFIIRYKTNMIRIAWVVFPYTVKPSTKNLVISLFFAFLVGFSASLDLLEVLVIANGYFLWTSVRTPAHKLIVFILVVVGVLIFMELEHLLHYDGMFTTVDASSTPLPAPVVTTPKPPTTKHH